MKKHLSLFSTLLVIFSAAPYVRFRFPPASVIWWPIKLAAGALAPLLAVAGAWNALLGLARREPFRTGAGLIAALFAAFYTRAVTRPHRGFEEAFGPDWEARIPPEQRRRMASRRWTPIALPSGAWQWHRDFIYGQSPATRRPLLADIWRPGPGVRPSGLIVIYIHGGAWVMGDKDMYTRAFFRRLAGQGHVIMDVAYTLWPESDMQSMVTEIKQAILWMKARAAEFKADPERIVLMGSSAGGHLALLAAYTPNHPAFQPKGWEGDTAVRAVVGYYPPVDLEDVHRYGQMVFEDYLASKRVRRALAIAELKLMKMYPEAARRQKEISLVAAILGGTPEQIPETYRLLSPIHHVGLDAPPTLLLPAGDDFFMLTPAVHRLYARLREANVPAIMVEYPYSDHAFDLILPQVSPVAQAATYEVERFLGLF
ncbi:MAG: alpha/beta hydrolase [Chloroflexi bacterium]|nr:alpha/beta hydrolase [Chloroflexota bacterium]